MKRITVFTLALFVAVVGFAQKQTPIYLDESKSTEERVEDALSRLTLEEKVAMIHAQSKFSTPGCPRLGIPEIWMSDGPHGVRAEIEWDSWGHAGWTNDAGTAYPALTCLAASFDPELAMLYGQSVGEEARFRKKEILLGPGCNIYRTPLNGRNFEYLGEDPYLASEMVVPYIQGVQNNGVAACVKHFALNNQEEKRDHIDVKVSDRALHEIYLPAFKAAVERGKVWTVMGAYNKYNGQHTSHHEILINKILKKDWAFDGVLVTDWGSAHDTKEAALNGLDIEMGTWTNGLTSNIGSAYDNYFLATPFLKLLKAGEIDEKYLDEKVRRVLLLNFRTNMDRNRPYGSYATDEHAQLSRKIAEQGVVLLKNQDNFFPIPVDKYKKILVVGENATRSLTVGGGSSELKVKKEVSPLEALIAKYGKDRIVHTMGYVSGPSVYGRVIDPKQSTLDSLKNKAIELAKSVDVVIYIGGLNKNHLQDCEGGDRQSYGLPFGQDELIESLIAQNKNFGMVIVSGNAVAMPWLPKVNGLIQSWYLGSQAGNALANIIAGDVVPSGKMPFSIPKKLSDNGAHHFGTISYPGDSIKVEYKDDIFVGYRWLEAQKIAPQFAFGYGLSYAKFEIKDVKADQKKYSETGKIKVSCQVANLAKVDGAEVVQVYAGKNKSKIARAPKELRAFRKIVVKAGTQTEVTLEFDASALAFYNEKTAAFEVEKGDYTLYVGNSSDNTPNKIKITIE